MAREFWLQLDDDASFLWDENEAEWTVHTRPPSLDPRIEITDAILRGMNPKGFHTLKSVYENFTRLFGERPKKHKLFLLVQEKPTLSSGAAGAGGLAAVPAKLLAAFRKLWRQWRAFSEGPSPPRSEKSKARVR